MYPDPVLVANTREWLVRAKEDLDNARHDLTATPPFVRDALFHCQQGVEKAMKALLTWHDLAFPKTHNLEELGELCVRIDGTLAVVMEDVTPLTEYAARFRYPGAPWEPTLQEARESIELARTFVDAILKRLPPGVAIA
jgi:HEPN domain-containing protein